MEKGGHGGRQGIGEEGREGKDGWMKGEEECEVRNWCREKRVRGEGLMMMKGKVRLRKGGKGMDEGEAGTRRDGWKEGKGVGLGS